MANLSQLLDVRPRNYSEWTEHVLYLKKKYTQRRNNSNSEKQQEATKCLSAINYIDELLNNISPDCRWTTIAVKATIDCFEYDRADELKAYILKACTGDEGSIKSVSKNLQSRDVKREWDSTIGKGIINSDAKPIETFLFTPPMSIIGEYVIPILASAMPLIFLFIVSIMTHTASFIEEDAKYGMSPFDFMKPMLVCIAIQVICYFAFCRTGYFFAGRFSFLFSYITTILTPVVSLLLLKTSFIRDALNAWNSTGSAKRFFIVYLVVVVIIWYRSCFYRWESNVWESFKDLINIRKQK